MDKNIKEQWDKLKREGYNSIHSLANGRANEAINNIVDFVEDTFIDLIYCPKCGSCGDTGCHPNPNVCSYLDTHQKDFDALVEREDLLYAALEKIDTASKTWRNVNPDCPIDVTMAYTLGQIGAIADTCIKQADDL